jgi:hypothetical protein
MYRRSGTGLFVACVAVAMMLDIAAGRASSAQTTTTEIKNFEIVGIDGNRVIIKDAQGARELTVPSDFRVNVNGKMVGVSELKPGMKGTATVTTTTTVKKVYLTEVKSGRITQVVGRNIIVMIKGETGYRMFTQEDARRANVFQNGKPLDWETLRVGDVLTATVVTEKETGQLTEKDVQTRITSLPAAATTKPATAPASSATSSTAAPPTSPSTGVAPSTPAPAPAESGGMSPMLIGGIVAALAVIGLILLGMRRQEEEKQPPPRR